MRNAMKANWMRGTLAVCSDVRCCRNYTRDGYSPLVHLCLWYYYSQFYMYQYFKYEPCVMAESMSSYIRVELSVTKGRHTLCWVVDKDKLTFLGRSGSVNNDGKHKCVRLSTLYSNIVRFNLSKRCAKYPSSGLKMFCKRVLFLFCGFQHEL